MKLTPEVVRAAFNFVKGIAFQGAYLPKGITFRVRRMPETEGMYHFEKRELSVNPRYVKDPVALLKLVAHEMCHAELGQRGFSALDEDGHHDQTFNELAAIVCERMGWRKNAIL